MVRVLDIWSENVERKREYCLASERIKTFIGWSSGNNLTLTPQKLCDAGFFYTGVADKVACYNCHLVLTDWAPEDDPLKLHEKYSSRCFFELIIIQLFNKQVQERAQQIVDDVYGCTCETPKK